MACLFKDGIDSIALTPFPARWQRVDLGESPNSWRGSALHREAEQFLWLTKCWLSAQFSQLWTFGSFKNPFKQQERIFYIIHLRGLPYGPG
jgi:hypothetical protein